MFVAHPAALPQDEVATVLFTHDDSFHDDPQAWDLPDCAVALWSRAGSWSADNRKDGFVPSSMLARFCSDPVQAVAELLRRRMWRKAKGGYQFCDWERHGETTEAVDRRRALAAERQRRSRARKETGRGGVTTEVRPDPVTRDSHVTKCDSALSDDQDLDHLSGVGQSDARARESPELVTAVADAICAKIGYVPTDDQALDVIAVIRERARKAGIRIRSPLAYIPAAVANEPDLWDGLLLPKPPPKTGPALPAPSWDPERHEYEPAFPGGPCRCTYTRSSPRHNVARAG